MKTLFILEFKKIAKKRMNIIVITACLLIIGMLFALPVVQYIALDTDGNQTTGSAAIALEKEYENAYAGKLTDAKISADIAEYQALFDNPDNIPKDSTSKSLTDSAYFKYFFPYLDYWKLINGNYIAPNTYDSSFSAIKNMNLEEGTSFYNARDKKVETILNNEKSFWINRISSIHTPYEYGYHAG